MIVGGGRNRKDEGTQRWWGLGKEARFFQEKWGCKGRKKVFILGRESGQT